MHSVLPLGGTDVKDLATLELRATSKMTNDQRPSGISFLWNAGSYRVPKWILPQDAKQNRCGAVEFDRVWPFDELCEVIQDGCF